MKISTLKRLLWFASIILLILCFPIQVKLRSEYPALLPYFLIGLVLLLPYRQTADILKNWARPVRMEHLIGFYLVLVGFHTSWQLLFGFMTPKEAGATLFIYVAPLIFYWYFSQRASLVEIRAVFFAILIAGSISGVFHAYDNNLRFGASTISDFSKNAISYSASRGQGGETFEDASSMRAVLGYRSFGLLETHTVSSTQTAFAAFAALALLPLGRKWLRLSVILIFGLLQLLGMTYTSFFAFCATSVLFEYRFIDLLKTKSAGRSLYIILTTVCIALLSAILPLILHQDMLSFLNKLFLLQTKLALGTDDIGYIDFVQSYAMKYINNILDFPPALLIGDGYSKIFGMAKGGDVGFIETLARLGIPLFLGAVVGLTSIVWKIHKNVTTSHASELPLNLRPIIQFSANVIFYLLVMELHYTVWNVKSVLPILFFSLGLYARFRQQLSAQPVTTARRRPYNMQFSQLLDHSR